MKKTTVGTLQVFTSKADAISRLMQLQGVCKDVKNSNNCRIMFHCNKQGKIIIESEWDRYDPKKAKIFTTLYGEIIEQDDKTQINYYTAFDKSSVRKRIAAFIVSIIVLLICLVLAASEAIVRIMITASVGIVVCIYVLAFQLSSIKREKRNA